MNEQERRKALYDAMGSIDPALVEQATHHRKNRRLSLMIRIVLVVVILAALIVAVLMHPGVSELIQW
jgi:t-SNARE complex subunit (syntaxin)